MYFLLSKLEKSFLWIKAKRNYSEVLIISYYTDNSSKSLEKFVDQRLSSKVFLEQNPLKMTTKSRLWSKIPLTIFHCVLSAWGHSILRGWAQWGQNLYKAEFIFSKSSNFMRYVQLLFCSEIQYKSLKAVVVICLILEKLRWYLQKNITFYESKSKWMLNSSKFRS